MRYDAADYLAQLRALAPSGAIWPRDADADLTKLLAAMADGLARVDLAADQLIEEADWRTTLQLLPDWERVAGLPDPCAAGDIQTVPERHAWLVMKMTMLGGQSKAFFASLAAALGYTITITEFKPFRAGASTCGDPLGGMDQWTTWEINLSPPPIWEFIAGASVCGDPLGHWATGIIECLFRRLQPAHTTLVFTYGN